jgi:hypothetical protein
VWKRRTDISSKQIGDIPHYIQNVSEISTILTQFRCVWFKFAVTNWKDANFGQEIGACLSHPLPLPLECTLVTRRPSQNYVPHLKSLMRAPTETIIMSLLVWPIQSHHLTPHSITDQDAPT